MRLKNQATDGKDIFVNSISDKGLIARIHKELSKLNRKATSKLITSGGSAVKNVPADARSAGSTAGLGRPLEEERQPTPVFLPGKSHGRRSPAGWSIRSQQGKKTTVTKKHKETFHQTEYTEANEHTKGV